MLWQNSPWWGKKVVERLSLLHSRNVCCRGKYFLLIFDVLECNWIFIQLFVNTALPSNIHRTLAPDNIDEKALRECKEVRNHVMEAECLFFIPHPL